ncbi:c-type cytochrome [Croceicoccus sediminis]|uniref:c-type cytochrome n=1 Tax=Croceicoccus sediminis TaxID=2571150 RepID=UPI0011821932|nr:c-type cytochrome [Croceicoccus sediminis]
MINPIRGLAAAGILALAALAVPQPALHAADGAAKMPSGEALFRGRACAACHSVKPGQNRAGPSLAGIVGQPVAAAKGYSYSPALKQAGGKWDEKKLDAWLADPKAVVPGTKMVTKVPSAQDRAAIIAYLKAN